MRVPLAWRLERALYEIAADGALARIDGDGRRSCLGSSADLQRAARLLLEDALGRLPASYGDRLARALIDDVLVAPMPGEPARIARRDLIAWVTERAGGLLADRFAAAHSHVVRGLATARPDTDAVALVELAAVRA